MGKKLSHIRDDVAGGGAPPYNDQPIKQDIADLKQNTAKVNTTNTFTGLQTFNDGIRTRFIEMTGQGTQDHDVVNHQQLKEQLHINVTNNNNTILGNWKLLTKPLYYYRYNGNVNLNNDQFRITSNVDNVVNYSISLKYNNEHIYLPFTIVAGNVSARMVKDANNGLIVKTTGLPNGSYETAIHLWYNKV